MGCKKLEGHNKADKAVELLQKKSNNTYHLLQLMLAAVLWRLPTKMHAHAHNKNQLCPDVN